MKAVLKKPWRSPRGNIYPAGTTFVKNDTKVISGLGSSWYNFNIPGGTYGSVLIPDRVFKRLTPEEFYIRELRQRERNAHTKATMDPFLRVVNQQGDND